MDRVRPANPRLAGIEPYDPSYVAADVMLSANENTRNLSPEVMAQIQARLSSLDFNRYPDPLANRLRALIAKANGLTRQQVLIGNGGDELLFNTLLAWGGEGRTLLNVPPTFSIYELYAQITGTSVVNVPRRADLTVDEEAVLARASQPDIDLVIITSPNNPSGDVVDPAFVERLLNVTDALVLIDEAYQEFSGQTVLPLLEHHKNLMILHTFSKAYSLAGARVGYIFADPSVIDEFLKVRQPYSVNALSQLVAEVVFENRAALMPGVDQIVSERARLIEELPRIKGVTVRPSSANYVLIHVPDAHRVWERLLAEHSVLVRDFSRTPGLEDCLRLSVGQPDEDTRLLDALRQVVED